MHLKVIKKLTCIHQKSSNLKIKKWICTEYHRNFVFQARQTGPKVLFWIQEGDLIIIIIIIITIIIIIIIILFIMILFLGVKTLHFNTLMYKYIFHSGELKPMDSCGTWRKWKFIFLLC